MHAHVLPRVTNELIFGNFTLQFYNSKNESKDVQTRRARSAAAAAEYDLNIVANNKPGIMQQQYVARENGVRYIAAL